MKCNLHHLVECWDQRLCEPEAEHQLGARHQQLRNQALEEGCRALVSDHVGDDLEATLSILEVAVLNTGLDNVERGGHDQRGASTSDGGDKVLRPGCGVVVLQGIEILLCSCGTTEEL